MFFPYPAFSSYLCIGMEMDGQMCLLVNISLALIVWSPFFGCEFDSLSSICLCLRSLCAVWKVICFWMVAVNMCYMHGIAYFTQVKHHDMFLSPHYMNPPYISLALNSS